MLDVLGMHPDEELVYRALVDVASLDVRELADRIDRAVPDARRLLEALESKGLAARSGSDDQRFVASPPSVALTALAVARQEELRAAHGLIATLSERYRSSRSHRRIGDLVDVIDGPAAVAQRFHQLQSAARNEVATLVRADVAYVTAEANTAEEIAVARGVTYRVVVERAAINRPGFTAAAEEALARGEEVRVVPKVPIRLIIADRELALVPMDSAASTAPGTGALLVHGGGLLDGLIALFDRVWRDAVPLGLKTQGELERAVADHSSPIDTMDAKIFGLLLAGLTDQGIGSQLGLSLRTVQRRVRALMDLAGVDTRLQLGYQAARNNWVRTSQRG